ncbi:MAG: bi-domain-containing oxidoreductase [bacterium]|nr:bi-domain-containing oxidoreductase [bacterium]
MKQLLLRKGQVEIQEVAAPTVQPGYVLIRTVASCISAGTEISRVEQTGETLVDKAKRKPELVKRGIDMLLTQGVSRTAEMVKGKLGASVPVGYSLAGRIIEVGAGIDDLHPGQRVAAAGASYAYHAEVVSVPRNLVVPVPDNISFEHAASVTLGAIALQGVRRAEPTLGECAAVIGLGLLGQITVQLLKASGVRVIGFDLDPVRVSQAKEIGCDMVINSGACDPVLEAMNFSGGAGVDFAIITAATRANAPLNQAIDMCRKKGRVVVVGDVGFSIERAKLYPKELDVLISTSYGPGRYDSSYEEDGHDYPIGYVRWTENRNMLEFLRLVGEKQIDISSLISGTYPLDDAAVAFDALVSEETRPLLVVLTYDDKPDADVLGRTIQFIPDPTPKKEGILNVGIIGAGSFATSMHLPNLSRMGDRFKIHTICDINGPTALDVAKQFNAVKHSSDAEEVCHDPDIDVILLTTRHDTHALLAMTASENGKAVFCEKPMGINRDQTLALAKLLMETGTPYLVGFNRRFSPAAKLIKNRISDINNPVVIVYTVNAGYLPSDHWAHSPSGGGRIVGEACHMIDLCSFFTGSTLKDLKATSITSGGGGSTTGHKYLSHDNVQLSLTYENGSIAQITYTALGAPSHPKERVEVYAGGWVFTIDDYKKLTIAGSSDDTVKYKGSEKGHREEMIEFSKWMRGEIPHPIELSSLLETTLATFAAYEQIGKN